MGARGPAPKREAERRRRNKPERPVVKVEAVEAVGPSSRPEWGPVASRWFDSLRSSAQSQFYQPSDWAVAELLAVSIDRELGNPEPISGSSLAALLKGMTMLLMTESDRRRVGIEIERRRSSEAALNVSHLDAARARRSR